MAEKYDREDLTSGNWNYAKGYVIDKIHKYLVLIDEYMNLAIFGYAKMESDVFIKDNNLKNVARLHAIRRLIFSIISLIMNTKFAIDKKDKKSFGDYLKRLKKIEKNLFRLRIEKKRGRKVVELNIDEDLFEKMIAEIEEMINDINYKLNKANLIFTHIEDMDIEKMKEAVAKKFIEKG